MAVLRIRGRAFGLLIGAAPIALFAAGGARAADVSPGTTTRSEATTVEVITVTANKRAESIQKVAADISAVSGGTIENNRLQTYYDIQNVVPGVVSVGGEMGRLYINMRGTFTQFNDSPSVEEPTSVYIDDVATLGDTDLAQTLYDVDRVEILKGPQGTSFGKNTIGGVVSIHTRPPSFTRDVQLSVTGGNYGLAEFQGLVTGPLSDQVAVKFTGFVHHQDGYIDDTVTGGTVGAQRSFGVRGQVLANVTDKFKVLASVDYLQDDSDELPTRIVSNGSFVASTSPFANPRVAAARGLPPLSYPTFAVTNDPNMSETPFNARVPRRSFSASVRADWDLDFATLTSITGYRFSKASSLKSELGDPLGILNFGLDTRGWQTTEELRLVSPGDRRFTWLTGLYGAFPHEEETAFEPTSPFSGYLFAGGGPQVGAASVDARSLSAYAEASYKIINPLKLVLGGRVTNDHKTGEATDVGSGQGAFAFTTITAPQEHSWTAFTPKATLEFTPTTDTLFYATVSRGYVGGGFSRAGPGVAVGPTVTLAQAIAADIAGLEHPYQPEYATNYEVGAKTSWFDNRLIANITLYREDIKDLQVALGTLVNGVAIREPGNAGRTRSQGVDLEVDAVPAPWLRLGAIYSYSDDKLLTNVANFGNAGNTLPDAPQNFFNLSVEGHWGLPGNWGTVSAGSDITFRSKVYSGGDFNADAPQVLHYTRIRGLVNGSIDFKTADGHWDFRLWGKNLTDTRYGTPVSILIQLAKPFGYTGSYYAELLWNAPRTFGVTATYHMR